MENDSQMLFDYITIKMNPRIYKECRDVSFYTAPHSTLDTFGAFWSSKE